MTVIKYNVTIMCMVDECIYTSINKDKSLSKCISCVERKEVISVEL